MKTNNCVKFGEITFRCRKFKARIELPRLVFESVSATHRCKNEC